jgi:hypothetical protein
VQGTGGNMVCYRIRRNGKTQTWKRKSNAERFRIPCKWGMHVCTEITETNAANWYPADMCPRCHTFEFFHLAYWDGQHADEYLHMLYSQKEGDIHWRWPTQDGQDRLFTELSEIGSYFDLTTNPEEEDPRKRAEYHEEFGNYLVTYSVGYTWMSLYEVKATAT